MCTRVSGVEEESLGWHWQVGWRWDNSGIINILHWSAIVNIVSINVLIAVPSKISDFMEHKAQFIVAHPCNPPYHTPMVELVPAPWTSDSVRTRYILSYCLIREQFWPQLTKQSSVLNIKDKYCPFLTRYKPWHLLTNERLLLAGIDFNWPMRL